jgi:peptidylprolyl isomerase domain and WD repeat-containing protein 1
MDFGPSAPPPPSKKLKKSLPHEKEFLRNLPSAQMYEKSYMHRDAVSHVLSCSTATSDFFVSASRDGHVKFWKKRARGVEFAKHFRAHVGVILDVDCSKCGTRLITLGEDGSAKIFDVNSFDMIGMIKLNGEDENGGHPTCIAWMYDSRKKNHHASKQLFAVGDSSGRITIHDANCEDLNQTMVKELRDVHGSSNSNTNNDRGNSSSNGGVVCMAYNSEYECVVSCDQSGGVEAWSADPEEEFGRLPIDDRKRNTNHQLKFSAKFETDLYALEKAKTSATHVSFSKDGKRMVICARDMKIRVFNFATCKLKAVFNEDLSAAEDAQRSGNEKYVLEDIDFGRRFASEKSLDEKLLDAFEYPNAVFDETGNFLMYGTIIGIKMINLKTLVVSRLLGNVENGERFTKLALFQGAAKRDASLKGSGKDYSVQSDGTPMNDPTLMCAAVGSQRVYLFSTREPEEEDGEGGDNEKGRDVFNEKPSLEDTRNATIGGTNGLGGASGGASNRLPSLATLHTNIGDISFKLFPKECPKTVENFTTHCRNGYYDDVIFHRVIKGFMIQTGDPLGDGTGGTSIWGSEFEDEINRDLRHDRAGVLSSANAGPNTNGSQFFITTVPTPWLDGKHSVFGRVSKGMDIVNKIENLKVDKADRPLEDVKIVSASVSFE